MMDVDAKHVSSRPAHVLIVDDDLGTRLLVERYMNEDYVVHTADSFTAFEQALADEHPVDIVLADIILRGARGGIDVLQTIRGQDAHADVPVIALTAYTVPDGRDHYLAVGFDGYISKPFTRRMLRQELGRFFS
jgi:CheY-like chemotaxis protein